eukprot:COSAG01_NODE_4967_length_4584_cov_12.666890_2_plen_121_part_00
MAGTVPYCRVLDLVYITAVEHARVCLRRSRMHAAPAGPPSHPRRHSPKKKKMPRHPTAYGAALALALVTMMLLVPRSTGQTTVHANCPSLASLPGAGGTGLKYYSCPNCCDVSPTCECDQ